MFFLPSVLEKSEFKDDSQFFRFYADEEMEGTSSKSKQLQRNDFKLIENILAKALVVSGHKTRRRDPRSLASFVFVKLLKSAFVQTKQLQDFGNIPEIR